MSSSTQLKTIYLEFWEKLVTNPSGFFIIIPHEKPDLDALASAHILLKVLIEKTKIPSEIISDPPNLETQKLLADLNIPTKIKKPDEFSPQVPYDVILVDMSDPQRFLSDHIRHITEKATRIFAIDHHITSTPPKNILTLYHPAPATTEIILGLGEALGILEKILDDENLVKLAILGILSDTLFFTLASPKTFFYMSLLSERTDYPTIVRKIKESRDKKDFPEKLALIKAMQRIILRTVGKRVICITHVGSYESRVANALINLGADLAIVISPKKEKGKKFIRIILRSKEIPLTPLAETISKTFHGTYGVMMDRAGGIQIHTNQKIDKIKKTILQIATNHLEKQAQQQDKKHKRPQNQTKKPHSPEDNHR